ncbi:MAG TPA: tRNA (adenosine(37)-N6)-threonylcarbamoyltransferase complex dimerization subunit type 1 TsaB [Candidatus Binatia bacterium]|nr:tRNA (adenosine(37)-N6)-threonylcarbamoyltransferase complex dimerization subunit type 1 TsaB [Candidatus Binatia bacterium]
MKGFYLALDTATEACSAAVWLDGAVRERFEIAQRGHTQRLVPMIRELLAECGRDPGALDAVVCGVGPGSFAGVRIGVGVAKGLALARGLPVVPVSSLAMLAQRQVQAGATHVACAIDARLGEIYLGAYRAEHGLAVALQPDRLSTAEAAGALPAARWHAAGTGWAAAGVALRVATGIDPVACDGAALPRALDALALALPRLAAGETLGADALVPAYLRDKVALTLEEQSALRRSNREAAGKAGTATAGES